MATMIQKYVWLIDTLRSTGGLTFPQINERWKNCSLNEERKKLHRSTLHRWRVGIKEQFSLSIDCDESGEFKYYISDQSPLINMSANNWIIENIRVGNTLQEYQTLYDRIVFDSKALGIDNLPDILEAMKNNNMLSLTYENLNNSTFTLDFAPYALRYHQEKWYVLGKISGLEALSLYPLEKIIDIRQRASEKFKMEKTFDAKTFFADYFGAVTDSNESSCNIVLRAYGLQANYLRTSPLHHSQNEIGNGGNYTDFSYHLYPTYDFTEKIMSMGTQVMVIEPGEYRDEIKRQVNAISRMYEDDPEGRESVKIEPLNGTFASIELEVANEEASSLCEIGVVIFRDGEVTRKFHSLVRPVPDYHAEYTSTVNRLTEKDTKCAPTFPEVWSKIAHDLEGLPLVSYIGTFDKHVLEATFQAYGIDFPDFRWISVINATRNLWEKRLPTMRLQTFSGAIGRSSRDFENALDVAEATGLVALQAL